MLRPAAQQGGAATVEFCIVAMLALLPLCLGMLQTSLLLIDNHHVDHAAFMAARAGATSQGSSASMRAEFARVLTPLFVGSQAKLDSGNAVARIGAARLRASVDVAAFARLRVLGPSAAAQRDFVEVRDGTRIIPNDSLEHRSAAPGGSSGLSLQQANMLRVEVTYCRPLVVPFVRGLLIGLLRLLDTEQANLRCYVAGRVPIRSVKAAPNAVGFPGGGQPVGKRGRSAPPPEIQFQLQPVGIFQENLPQADASESFGWYFDPCRSSRSRSMP